MGRARRSTARIGIWLGLAAVMAVALTVTAYALTRGDHHPPKRSLAAAIHHALSSKPVAGVRADFTVSQHLLPGTSSLLDSSPLAGAGGSVWASGDRARLVVRSQLGTAEVGLDGRTVTLYLPKSHAAYVLALPQQSAEQKAAAHDSGTPSLAEIRHTLVQLGRTLDISGAVAGNVAGRPAYTVRVSSRQDSGLIGPLAVAFDAANGTPLRVALYPRGSSTAAIAFEVSHIHYGKVPSSQTAVRLPAGTHVTHVHLPSKAELTHAVDRAKKGTHSSAAPVTSAAPASLAGMPRTAARTLSSARGGGLLAVYGHGLGSVVVIEHSGGKSASPDASSAHSMLPSVSINGAGGSMLQTTLGTIVTFSHGGKQYVVIGARPASTILAAARALG